MDFIFGLALALPVTAGLGIGTVTGVGQGVSQQQKENEKAKNANPESRMVKFHVDVAIDAAFRKLPAYPYLNDGIVVLRDDKLWVEERKSHGIAKRSESHPFTGFFLTYPDEARVPTVRGLVSTVSLNPPLLNWIYVDKETYELKYSNRSGSIEHIVGEWDWTDEFEDSCLSFDGWEPFIAVEEKGIVDEEGRPRYALYVDVDDDGLKAKKKGRKTLEVSLERKVVTDQEFNKWGIGQEGNIGFKSTKEIDKISEKKKQREQEGGVQVEHKE